MQQDASPKSHGCVGCKGGTGLPFEIRTAFHPIVDLESGRPFAYEALVRGANGEGAPAVLAQVTDQNRYEFDQACRVTAIREAVAAGLLETDAKLSINFLPNAVYSPMACIRLTLQAALETGLPTNRLIFEFTENEQLDTAHVREIVRAYRSLGFATALDDFGAGYSGLGLLADIQPDMLKIDMALVRGIDSSSPRQKIVSTIVGLCKDMDLLLIAEGIETDGELAVLRELGLRYVQGFLFSRPTVGELPSIETQQMLKVVRG